MMDPENNVIVTSLGGFTEEVPADKVPNILRAAIILGLPSEVADGLIYDVRINNKPVDPATAKPVAGDIISFIPRVVVPDEQGG